MKCVEELLTDNEKIICKEVQKTNPTIYILFIIGGGLLVLFLIAGIDGARDSASEIGVGGVMLGGLLFSLPFILPGIALLRKQQTTEIVLTNKRVIYKFGALNIRLTEIDLKQIEGITLKQGEGTLLLRGTGTGAVKIPLLKDPIKFRNSISEAQSLDNSYD